MSIIKKFLLPSLFSFLIFSCNNVKDNYNTFVLIKTTLGNIKVRLYDETPSHRDNFIKLVNSHFYEGVSFHRVIKDFMIQAGDASTKSGVILDANDTLNTYTLQSEFITNLFHKKGALAAARESNDVNPEMRSSGTQFYIVEGIKYTDSELDQAEQRINNNIRRARFIMLMKELSDSNRISGLHLKESEIQEKASLRLFEIMTNTGDYKLSEEKRKVYKTIGGTPFLDRTYTVFGEVTEGLDIVDKIAHVETDKSDKPLIAVRIEGMKLFKK